VVFFCLSLLVGQLLLERLETEERNIVFREEKYISNDLLKFICLLQRLDHHIVDLVIQESLLI
jgi:hypothetical protein